MEDGCPGLSNVWWLDVLKMPIESRCDSRTPLCPSLAITLEYRQSVDASLQLRHVGWADGLEYISLLHETIRQSNRLLKMMSSKPTIEAKCSWAALHGCHAFTTLESQIPLQVEAALRAMRLTEDVHVKIGRSSESDAVKSALSAL
jgi:hypothetical protein